MTSKQKIFLTLLVRKSRKYLESSIKKLRTVKKLSTDSRASNFPRVLPQRGRQAREPGREADAARLREGAEAGVLPLLPALLLKAGADFILKVVSGVF